MTYKIDISGDFGIITKTASNSEYAHTLAGEISSKGFSVKKDDVITFYPVHRVNLVVLRETGKV